MEIEVTAKIDVYDVLDEINTYKANFREAYLVEALNHIEWYSERDEVTLSEAAKKQIYEWITRKLEWIKTIYPDANSH